ncbi:hypothetical protein [Haemophilus sputorum]|uniref:hypothetical protein n=1 Tax=Haemophilus sputorum TaxID=1078480 RepID=UPI0028D2290F|nr:hypothetical protein [Haemophilus sputorum]
MSSKINIFIIIKDHINSLKDYQTQKLSIWDIISLIVIPIIFSLSLIYFRFSLNKEFVSLIVSFASIVTSLLISVSILIYDQYAKINYENMHSTELKIEREKQLLKKRVLSELFSNVSFTILMGVITVILCLGLSIFPITPDTGVYITPVLYFNENYFSILELIFTPAILFSLLEMILTLFMSLKRLHIIFFAQ